MKNAICLIFISFLDALDEKSIFQLNFSDRSRELGKGKMAKHQKRFAFVMLISGVNFINIL